MSKSIKLTNAHPEYKGLVSDYQEMTLNLLGGAPFYAYVYIDGVQYELTFMKVAKLKKVYK